MVRLKVRNGAFVVITAILMISMFAVMAVAVDFSRMGSLRNELQISADASALGGALQIQPSMNGATAYDSAVAYATRNTAMQGTVTVDSVIFGNWDDAARTFTPLGSYVGADAITTVVSRQSTGLTMTGLLGVAAPRIKARATAWAQAPVSNFGCMKPWAIPYPLLMSRINAHNGVTNTAANLTRPFTSADLDTVMAMTAAERQFALHLGTGLLDTAQISGNYQAVKLGKYWDAATQTYASPQPVNGATAYRDNVSGATCHGISIGDSLQTNQGLAGAQNTVDPFLIQGSPARGVCTIIRGYGTDNTPQSDPRYGDCVDANGNVGVSNISLFYACTSGCNGASTVATMMMASFKIDKVYPQRQTGSPSNWDMAEITGTFEALTASGGRVGPAGTSSILSTIILVR
jgi:Flp pilus assembly protein TadG